MINKNYTLLWLGKIISQLGDKFYGIALAWWILQKTNSPSIMGLFLFITVLPGILLGFFAGAFVDRWKRKLIIIITDIIRGILVLAISYMAFLNRLEVWHVFVIAFILSIATAFFDPASQAILPEIVEKEVLIKANSLSQMVSGICTILGPILGALAISIFGIAWVFLSNSISYLISASFAAFIVVKKEYRDFNEKKYLFQSIIEGIHFIKDQKKIIFILKIIAVAHFFLGSLMVSLPFIAKSLSGKGVNNLGLLEMFLGLGLIGGSIFIGINKNISINEVKLTRFIGLVGISFILISIVQYLKFQTIFAYILELSLIGVCIACASVFWQSLLQNYTPDHMTGRVFSVSSLIGNITLPLAYGIFGVLIELNSIYIIMALCGLSLITLSCYFNFRN